jgi:nicotinate-nucleotide pyrophosphorylase (carboxylating)
MNIITEEIIRLALFEDSGFGDITTDSIVSEQLLETKSGHGEIVAKQAFILAGIRVAERVFRFLDQDCEICMPFKDGDKIQTGDTIMEIRSALETLLKGERVALNFLQRLSGIATLTRKFADTLSYPKVRLTDTRKTTPGLRYLEKEAVRVGGAANHRMSLYDGVLIKDNHISVAGSITNAVNSVRKRISHLMKIEVEVSNMDQVKEALNVGVDVIMLDNMNIESMKKAVKFINGRAIVEASGNVSLNTLNDIAATGVDIISCGAIIHQAGSVDLSMRIHL